jgi:hypothetical protein
MTEEDISNDKGNPLALLSRTIKNNKAIRILLNKLSKAKHDKNSRAKIYLHPTLKSF